MIDAQAIAEARHRAYALLGRIFVEGLTGDSRSVVEALPRLNETVSREDPDAWAVEHERALVREVFPYESVFRSDDGLLGGPIGGAVSEAYARSGLTGSRLDVESDHLGLELAHLAHLCAAERDALADGAPLERLTELQGEFLAGHLLAWAPGVLAAIVRGPSPFYAAVAELAVEVIADHATSLGVRPEAWPVPDVDPLANPKTRLRDLAEHLLRPARSGWFLGRDALGDVAARADLPSGFGPRNKLLEGLMFAGADHRRAPELLRELRGLAGAWDETYARFAAMGLPVQAWRDRLATTRALLEQMESAVTA